VHPVKHILHFHDDTSASEVIWMYPVKYPPHLFISRNHRSCSSSFRQSYALSVVCDNHTASMYALPEVFLTFGHSILVAFPGSDDMPRREPRLPQVIWVYPAIHMSQFYDDNSASQVIRMYPVKYLSHLLITLNHRSCSTSFRQSHALSIVCDNHSASMYAFPMVFLTFCYSILVAS
jgi:hypothetical protein